MIINKKIAGDARCGKRTEFSLGSSILSLAILSPLIFQVVTQPAREPISDLPGIIRSNH
jgi:hypothetical protein